MPEEDVTGSMARIASDEEAAKHRLTATVPCLDVVEVENMAGGTAGLAAWRADGRLLSVERDGRESFPAFQFADGEPVPVVGEILAVFGTTGSRWEAALWFVSSEPRLDGRAPASMLDDPAVLDAARGSVDAAVRWRE